MNPFSGSTLTRLGRALILLILLAMAGPGLAERPSSAMLDAMQSMVDSMTDYVEQRRGSGVGLGEWLDRRAGQGLYSDEYEDLRILYMDMGGAPARSSASRTQLIDGVWMGRNRSVLMIRDGYLRAFAYSLAHYQEAELYLEAPRMQIRNLDTGVLREYDFVYRGGKLAMRDDSGQVFLYRRVDLGGEPTRSWR